MDEAVIHPSGRGGFQQRESARNELHRLPWPIDELSALRRPSSAARHPLCCRTKPIESRLDRPIRRPRRVALRDERPEDSAAFRRRVNKQARGEGEKPLALNAESGWLFGRVNRPRRIFHRYLVGVGPASRPKAVVVPVAGWWKNRPKMDQSDTGVNYSLVISIEAPEVEVDLWTPVYQQVAAVIEV